MSSRRIERLACGLVAIGAATALGGGCAGRTVEAGAGSGAGGAQLRPDASTGAGGRWAGGAGGQWAPADASAHDGGTEDAAADGGAPGDAATGPADWDAGPQNCSDVGKFPGQAKCCEANYCAGSCWNAADKCSCGGTLGGCIWPAVCCNGMCVGPCNPNCMGEYCK